jgi:glycosylphosphatidylinositol transamidase (GPIT) subunit GPI8
VRVVSERHFLIVLYLFSVKIDVFFNYFFQLNLLLHLLIILISQQVVEQGASRMNDVLIFLEDGIGYSFYRYPHFVAGVGCEVYKSEQGLEDDQLILAAFDIMKKDICDGLPVLVLDKIHIDFLA